MSVLGAVLSYLIIFFLGFTCRSLYSLIEKMINEAKGKIICKQSLQIPKNAQELLDKKIKEGKHLNTTESLVGKQINYEGEEYLVIQTTVTSINESYGPDITLILYSNGRLRTAVIGPWASAELYEKCLPKPIRSREIRRDVKRFCNSSCILDCTDCILKKYGKPKGDQTK